MVPSLGIRDRRSSPLTGSNGHQQTQDLQDRSFIAKTLAQASRYLTELCSYFAASILHRLHWLFLIAGPSLIISLRTFTNLF